MNVQTERLENHTARFTVEVESGRLDKAKQEAARKIARRYTIPGFRKGKAPYRVVINYFGEESILSEAIDVLSNEIYKDALDSAGVEPYGPGALEDFAAEPQPTFKFVVPLQPTVDLGNYRDIRIAYEAPVVEDKEVDQALESMQEREALIEESAKPVAAGNRVTLSLRATYLDSEEAEAEEASEEDAESEGESGADNVFLDEESLIFRLTPDHEPAPGFTDALVGATVDEQRVFEITYPDDEEEYQHLAGRHVKFEATVRKIETMTLPELNDDFAARVTQEEGQEEGKEPLTLLELRMRIREDLEEEANNAANAEYAQKVLEQIIEQSTYGYPDAMVADEIEHLLQHLDRDLRQRGLTLDDYMKVSGKSTEDLVNDYRDNAIESIKRSLAMRELIQQERLAVTEEQVSAEIDKIAERFGEQAAAFRSIYEGGSMRANLRSDLLYRQLTERLAAIAKGEAPELPTPGTETETTLSEEETDEEGETS